VTTGQILLQEHWGAFTQQISLMHDGYLVTDNIGLIKVMGGEKNSSSYEKIITIFTINVFNLQIQNSLLFICSHTGAH
jgi:hypothetical protein